MHLIMSWLQQITKPITLFVLTDYFDECLDCISLGIRCLSHHLRLRQGDVLLKNYSFDLSDLITFCILSLFFFCLVNIFLRIEIIDSSQELGYRRGDLVWYLFIGVIRVFRFEFCYFKDVDLGIRDLLSNWLPFWPNMELVLLDPLDQHRNLDTLNFILILLIITWK